MKPNNPQMRAEARDPKRKLLADLLVLVGTFAATGSFAQSTPVVALSGASALTLSASDNQLLERADGAADVVLQPQVNVRLNARGAVVRGNVDYTLAGSVYTRDSEADSIQNTLLARLVASPPGEGWAVTGDASISQQPRSAFGRYSGTLGPESDRTEVRTLQIAPSLEGRLGDGFVWSGRLAARATRSTDASTAAVDTFSGKMQVGAESAGRVIVPSIGATANVYDFRSGRRTSQAEVIGALSAAVDLDLRVGLQAGAETNNFRSVDRKSAPLWGASLGWEPSPRTRLDASAQHRDASNSHDVSFQHRFPRSAVQFRDSRAVTTPDATLTPVGIGTAYDVLFFQLTSAEPDPDRRRALVEAYLRQNNIDPRQPVVANVLTNSLLDQRVQSLAFSWTGLRDSATLALSRTTSRKLNDFVPPAGSDGFSSSDQLRQTGIAVGLSHRLTPLATLGADVSLQRTRNEDGRTSSLVAMGLLWSTRLSPGASINIGARHLENRSALDPYEATLITTTARLEF